MKKEEKLQNIPQHIGIIMDGNRRWAREGGLPSLAGHRQAAQKTIEPLIEKAGELGIKFITFWAFSTENWQRGKQEVAGLLTIFRHVLKTQAERLHKRGARVRIIGDLTKFPADLQKGLEEIIQKTKENKAITVIFALNYGGRDEIIRAVKRWHGSSKFPSARAQGEGKVQDPKLTESEFSNYLDTAGLPDPDLIIRTGEVMRLSGFLPWQGIYAELYFSKVMFPDFTPQELIKAIRFYQKRERRFGK